MMLTQTKEQQALALIEAQLATARTPIVACSFGKDSIVLLHLCLRIKKVPVLFLRFAKFHEKHAHALSVMQAWDLEAYDLWPTRTMDYQHGEFFEVLHGYSTGQGGVIWLFSGIRKRREAEPRYLCAVDDLLLRPCAQDYGYPWDVTFHGHKGTDDPELGAVGAIVQPVSQLGGTRLVVPFVDWTDADIWDYIRRYDLPYDRKRYDERNESVSPDKYPTCFKCLDGNESNTVLCPKRERLMETLRRTPVQHAEFRESLIAAAGYCEVTGAPRSTENVEHL